MIRALPGMRKSGTFYLPGVRTTEIPPPETLTSQLHHRGGSGESALFLVFDPTGSLVHRRCSVPLLPIPLIVLSEEMEVMQDDKRVYSGPTLGDEQRLI